MIVNEFTLRTDKRVTTVFEPGSRKFEFGDTWLRNHPLQSNRLKSGNSSLFERQSIRVTEVVTNAPKEIRDGVKKQDEIVQNIQKTVDNIRVNMDDIKQESRRQTEQAEKIHGGLNKTLEDTHRQSYNARRLV